MADQIADVAEVIYYVEDAASPMTIVKPASFMPSQVLVFIIAQDAPLGLADLTGPPGWVDKGNYNDAGGGSSGRVWVHPYNAADPNTWDFGYSVGAGCVGALARIVGADTTPVITVVSSINTHNSGTATSPDITPAGINDLLLNTIAAVCTGGIAFVETDPPGSTNLGQIQLLDLYVAIALASKQLTDGNSTGTKTWSNLTPANSAGGTFSIVIKSSGFIDPDPPPNPPPPLVPPWMMRQLISGRSQPLLGGQRTPVIKEKLSNGASNANFTLTTAATTAVDDILVLFHGNNFYTAAGLVAPTGTAGTWNPEVTADNGTNNTHMKIWTRKVTVGGAQTVTCARAIDEEHTAHLFVISGADTVTFVDGTATGNVGASSTTHVSPSATPTTTNGLYLTAVQSAALGVYTIPSTFGMTKQAQVDVGGICSSASGAEVLGNNSATGTRTWTNTVAGNFAACSIVIKAPQDVTAPTSTNCNAECATFTLAGQDAVNTIAATSEAATYTLAGQDATVTTVTGTSAIAEAATFTIPAQDATTTILTNAEAPSIALAGQDATLSIQPPAIEGTLTVASQDATPAVGVNAEGPSFTLAALDATVVTGTLVNPAEGAFTLTGQDATSNVGPNAESALWSLVAQSPAVSLGVSTEVAPFTTTAQDATNTIAPNAEVASFTLSALDAIISTSSAVNCAAQTATISFAANDAVDSIAATAEASTLTFTAQDAASAIGTPAGVATLTMVAQDASLNVQPLAQSADVSLSALNLSALIAFVSDYAAFSIAVQVVAVTTATYGWPLTVGKPSTLAVVKVGTPTNVSVVNVGAPTTIKVVSVGTPY